jgi:hypothetical protein
LQAARISRRFHCLVVSISTGFRGGKQRRHSGFNPTKRGSNLSRGLLSLKSENQERQERRAK